MMRKWIQIGNEMDQIAILNTFLILTINSHQIYSRRINCTKKFPVHIYFSSVNNRNTRKRCEICSKLTIKPPE